jgi:hypothetical protein
MKVVKVDEAMRQQLATLGEEAILLDANGRVLAHLVSGERAKSRFLEHAHTLFDLAEVERSAATERTGHTCEEVKAHLKALETGECATP